MHVDRACNRETEAQECLRSHGRLGAPVRFPLSCCQLLICCHTPLPACEHLVLLTCSHHSPVRGSILFAHPVGLLQTLIKSSRLCGCEYSHQASRCLLRSAFNPQIRQNPGNPQGSQDIVTLEIRGASQAFSWRSVHTRALKGEIKGEKLQDGRETLHELDEALTLQTLVEPVC